jgi:DNA repair exonuclease SbcCD ATPase subunit
MTKILLISDLHIDKFNGDQSRLDNYLLLANDLLQIAKDNDIHQLYILGDIINKSVTTPEVLSTLSKFINTLSSSLSISYILGQHDYNLSDIQSNDLSHTYLSLLPMTYLANQSLIIDNVNLSFADYSRDKHIIAPKCDIFLSHISYDFIDYDDTNVSMFTVAGDIHKPNDYTNYHHPAYSISPPIQLHPSEPNQGYAMILTLDNGLAIISRIKLPIHLTLLPTIHKSISTNIVSTNLESNIDDILDNDNLKSIHSHIISEIDKLPTITTFTISKLVIDNLKSINHMTIDFNPNDHIIYISGNNGSGKSTIMEALLLSFTGFGTRLSKYKPINTNHYPSLEVSFSTIDHNYILTRNESGITLLEDNINIQLGKSKQDCQLVLESRFPIIRYLSTLFIQTYTHFLDSHNLQSLLSLYLDLKYYEDIVSTTKSYIKKVSTKISDLTNKQFSLTSNLDLLDMQYSQLLSDKDKYKDLKSYDYYQSKLNDCNNLYIYQDRLAKSKSRLSSLQSSKVDISSYPTKSELLDMKSIIETDNANDRLRDKLQSQIDKLKSEDKYITCPSCGTSISTNQLMIGELQYQLIDIPPQTYVEYDLSTINDMISTIDKQESLDNDISDLNNDISYIESKIKSINVTETHQELLDGLTNSKISSNLDNQITSNRNQYNDINNQISTIKSDLDKSNLQLSLLELYKSKFDITNMSSVPYNILTTLLSSISNDDIKFITSTTLVNGESRFKISATYNNIDYDLCSQGQKTIIDITLFQTLLTTKPTMPFVLLDETLSTLKSDNYDKAIDIIDDINADKIIITSHQLDYNHYDSKIEL